MKTMSRDVKLEHRAAEAARDVSRSFFWPAVLLFGSGVAALTFQILWIKQLTLVVGVDIFAVTTGVSAFFAGLALGGLVLGPRADRTSRPFLFYAALETNVAVLGLAATWLLALAPPWFAALEASAGPLAWLMVFLLIGIPAGLMGGTLPVLVRALTASAAAIGATGGGLYAANTFGAIAGALFSTFLLIPTLGIKGTGLAAAAIGLTAALAAILIDRRAAPAVPKPAKATAVLSRDAKVAVTLYALAGGVALGYEIVWSQSIVQFMSTRTFAFSVVLATYLAGLALGAALFARWADRVRNPWGMFGLLIAAAGLVALVEVFMLGDWLIGLQTHAEKIIWTLTGSDLASMCARFAVAAAAIVFLPTLLLGAAFPAALRLIVAEGHVGQGVGVVAALNTLGGIAGTVLTGFVLVPQLGLIRTLAMLALAAAGIGLCAVLWGRQGGRLRATTCATAAAACLVAALIPADKFATLLPGARKGNVVFYEEGLGATVAVVEQKGGTGTFRRLYIQGVSNTGDSLPSLRYMRLQALLPLVIRQSEPKSALVVGLGTGITAGALLNVTSLERRVVAELLPGVGRAAAHFAGNYGAVRDTRLDIRLRDGRRELLQNADRYDLITLEPPPPSAAGVANLYSTDFYRLAASRLEPGGMVAQWLPLPTQNGDDTRALVKSFIEIFPHATLWTTELHEMLLIGSFDPMPLDLATFARRFAEPAVRDALAEVGIASPAALLSTWIADRDRLVTFAGTALPVTDDRPRIEYASWVKPKAFVPVLVELFALRHDPPVIGADAAFQAELRRERDLLDAFYQAGIYAYTGDRQGWQIQMRKVAAAQSGNPYYEWFSSGEGP
jgi:spermidine synthase